MVSLTTGMGRTDAFAALFQERRLLVQLVRTGTEQECAFRVGIDPFAKPSANGRYLRIPAGRSRPERTFRIAVEASGLPAGVEAFRVALNVERFPRRVRRRSGQSPSHA